MMRFMQQEWKFLSILAVLIVVFGLAYYEYRQYKDYLFQQKQPVISVNVNGEPSKPGEPQIVQVQGQNTHTKEIVYVQKEVDPVTKLPEKTDVQFERKASKIYVKVNGKEYEVPSEVKEDAKFEKGKLVITEQSELRLNLTAPKPSVNLGVGWSLNGPAVQVNGPLYKNVSWWLYGDKKTFAGGVQFPIMK
jgi:hypothetical protein